MNYVTPKLIMALLALASVKEVNKKADFRFASDHFRSNTGLTNEHDATLKKLDWYFEDLKNLAS